MSESNREQRWAEHENQHRQESYREALNAWQLDHDELTRLLRTARSYDGGTASPDSPVVLKRGESVYAELASAGLVEVQRGAGHYTGGYSGFSFRLMKGVRYNVGGSRGTYVQGDEQLRITDEGRVTVTSKRVVFTGERNAREWAYAKLVSVQHDGERPVTMIGVSNRQKLSGLAYPVEATSELRFKLSLAVAQAQGTVPALVASLEAELAEQAKTRPIESAAVTAAQAPQGVGAFLAFLSVLFTGKKTWKPIYRAGQALAIAIVLIAAISTTASGGTKHPAPSAAALVPAQTLTVPVPLETETSTPAPAVVPVPAAPKPAATHAPVTHPPVVHRHVAPKPKATATHTSKPASQAPVTYACTTTSSGTCIKGGQFCPNAKDGQYGYDGEGRTYICRDDHWRVP
jgi:hypothetical protein